MTIDSEASTQETTPTSDQVRKVAVPHPKPASSNWRDKYRPQSVDELLHSSSVREQLQAIVAKPDNGWSVLLFGDKGMGKTTTAEVMIREMGLSFHMINGGLRRGVDVVRELKTMMENVTVYMERRGILIDEIDGFTAEALSGLRGDTLEDSRITSEVFATCNDLSKLTPMVRDRFLLIDLDKERKESREELLNLHVDRACAILDAEAVPYDLPEVKRVVSAAFPSIRSWLTVLQARAAIGAIRSKTNVSALPEIPSGSVSPVAEGSPVTEPLEPTREATDLSRLLDDIARHLGRFISTDEANLAAMALYVLHTYAHDAALHSPLLWLSSAVKRCGKTTALKAVSRLVPNPIITANTSIAGMLDLIELEKPTFLIDEMEHALKATSGLHGILNLGHARDGYMIRKGKRYRTWAPKVLALIGELPDTLADRSIRIALRRRLPTEKVDRFQVSDMPEATDLKMRCQLWADSGVHDALVSTDPTIPTELSDRAQDNWRPLLGIADLAEGGWPEKARASAIAVSGHEEIELPSAGILILKAARDLLETKDAATGMAVSHVASRELAEAAAAVEAVSGRIESRMIRIARILAGLSVHRTTYRDTEGVFKGFARVQLEDAFNRYLADDDS